MHYKDAIELRQHGMKHCRAVNDHNAAHKFFRRVMMMTEAYAIELNPGGVPLPEIAHAVRGPEFKFWPKLPTAPAGTNLYTWSWKEMIACCSEESLATIFHVDDGKETRFIETILYVCLKGT